MRVRIPSPAPLNRIMNPLDLVILFFDKLAELVKHKSSITLPDRRKTFVYKKKQKIVKNVWTVALIFIAISLQYPLASVLVIVIAMLTTFLSFAILDETIEKRIDK